LVSVSKKKQLLQVRYRYVLCSLLKCSTAKSEMHLLSIMNVVKL